MKINKLNEEKKRGTLLSLRNGDKIFGIRLSFNGHRLKEPDELSGHVDIVGYCDIENMDLRSDGEDFRISISHPTEPFGVTITLPKSEYEEEHCYLHIDTMKSGYDGFYTLNPENWKKDLIEAHKKVIKNRKKNHQKNLDILDSKIQLFMESEVKINEHLK